MSSYVTKKTPGDTAWFTHDRFGMFIHFGLYAMPARHEWIKTNEKISEEKYDKYFKYFNPDLYDPKEWARQAKAAGMKYVVLTTKHHEGFCLFDSKYTDYKATNTPAGRDLIKEYVDAFRAEGLHIGFYYSLIDWHHPDFVIDYMHPLRDIENVTEVNKTRDMHKYAEYMRNQVEELLTNYGKIEIMWYDFSYTKMDPDRPWLRGKDKNDWEAEELIALTRRLQPGIIIDNRTGIDGDIWTPEQFQPDKWITHKDTGELVTWEACQTFSGSWGYHRDEQTWKSPEMLIQMLVETVSLGGNLIMNVGPTSRGYFDKRAEKALAAYAEWMKYNSRSIYGCTMAEPCFKAPKGTRITQSEDGKRLYLHLFEWPFNLISFDNLSDKIDYAQFLHDGSEIKYKKFEELHEVIQEGTADGEGKVFFELPVIKPDVLVPVIEIFLK